MTTFLGLLSSPLSSTSTGLSRAITIILPTDTWTFRDSPTYSSPISRQWKTKLCRESLKLKELKGSEKNGETCAFLFACLRLGELISPGQLYFPPHDRGRGRHDPRPGATILKNQRDASRARASFPKLERHRLLSPQSLVTLTLTLPLQYLRAPPLAGPWYYVTTSCWIQLTTHLLCISHFQVTTEVNSESPKKQWGLSSHTPFWSPMGAMGPA